jgi:16S rRNA processing protein RimM
VTTDAQTAQWVKVGVVGRAHGLRGAFFVSYREDPIPKSYGTVRIGDAPMTAEKFEIRTSKLMNGRPLLQCGGFSRREHAEAFVGKSIWVHRTQISLDESKQYIWSDLIGKPVVDANGQLVGEIFEVRNFGASDLAAVRDNHGRSVEIPIVASYFDMNFTRLSPELKLAVKADTFDELWVDRE